MESFSSTEDYFSSSAAACMAEEISRSRGKEILFCGKTGDGKIVENVRILSRGNDYSAPAIINQLSPGEVLIHNHPSGNLNPSDADINIASLAGNLGAGFFIINNEADNIYVVVPLHEAVNEQLLDHDEVLGHFKDDSKISAAMSDYELRPEQAQMAEIVTSAFNNNSLAIIEAGTGVGKSMAYLIPAVLRAVKNKDRVVISTNTINLQEQLISKDIPLIHENVCDEFKAVLVKGQKQLCMQKEGCKPVRRCGLPL